MIMNPLFAKVAPLKMRAVNTGIAALAPLIFFAIQTLKYVLAVQKKARVVRTDFAVKVCIVHLLVEPALKKTALLSSVHKGLLMKTKTIVLFCLLLFGCDKSVAEVFCEDVELTEIISSDAVSERLGFSAQQVLDALESTVVVTARTPQEQGGCSDILPTEESTELTFHFFCDGGEVTEHSFDTEVNPDCESWLEIDIDLTIQTSNGYMDETWAGYLKVMEWWDAGPEPRQGVYLYAGGGFGEFAGFFHSYLLPTEQVDPNGYIDISNNDVSCFLYIWGESGEFPG